MTSCRELTRRFGEFTAVDRRLFEDLGLFDDFTVIEHSYREVAKTPAREDLQWQGVQYL